MTCSHHLNHRFWSGGFLLNGSIESSIYKLSSRAPRFFCPDTDSLCCQHPSCLFTDADRCIMISVHLISTLTVIDMPFPDEAGHLPVPANLLLSEMDIPFYTWPVCVLTFSLSFHTLESYHQASDCTENDNSQMFCQEVSSVLGCARNIITLHF